MWQLVVILFINLFPVASDSYIIIIDDCSKWKKINLNRKMGDDPINDVRFIYTLDVKDLSSVSIERMWIEEMDKPELKKFTLKEIYESNLFFTSEFSTKGWFDFVYKLQDKKIYLVVPEEYCSQKRFAFQYEFTLYEVRISLPMKE